MKFNTSLYFQCIYFQPMQGILDFTVYTSRYEFVLEMLLEQNTKLCCGIVALVTLSHWPIVVTHRGESCDQEIEHSRNSNHQESLYTKGWRAYLQCLCSPLAMRQWHGYCIIGIIHLIILEVLTKQGQCRLSSVLCYLQMKCKLLMVPTVHGFVWSCNHHEMAAM